MFNHQHWLVMPTALHLAHASSQILRIKFSPQYFLYHKNLGAIGRILTFLTSEIHDIMLA